MSSIVSTTITASIISTDYPPLDDEANKHLESGSSDWERLAPEDITQSQVYSALSNCKEQGALESVVISLLKNVAVNLQGIRSPIILEACLRTCQQHHLDLEALFHGHVYGERTLIYHVILGTESNEPENKQRVGLMLELLNKIPLDENSSMNAQFAYDVLRNWEVVA
ncbi:hypothetical protein M422DRAFT_272046 [Sphaerobolus stellatus SS14]|uniref:Uncharacterized protein n=1 Tax=Sphaerobolus stellatus (strain SS14) TaxID=990650 RepID=A0A0C9TCD8_SPHS4|nr:hypothetical protein M422DRAFT_272046 [Sphaerobolus stellatus SS14]